MSTWQEFYNEIRDPSWPDCPTEDNFLQLPKHIQKECQEVFGYHPGQFRKTSKLSNRVFPIHTETACQLKWNWSTIFLVKEETSSCHRTDHHKFDTETFNFHNTPNKLDDRKRMLAGQWPARGCEYCKNIEDAGGISDRITNLDFPGIHAPPELDTDSRAIEVTPRILEVYFDNTCNLKCVYCTPRFSSLWDAENKKFGTFQKGDLIISDNFVKSSKLEENKQKLFLWLRKNVHNLTTFNILGGEPLYQKEFDECLDLFDQYPAPDLKLQIFTNLNTTLNRLTQQVERVRSLIDRGHLREFEVTASLDCWGPEQEYVRFPLDLTVWEENFNYLLEQHWINLIVSSTVTALTIKTLPDLLVKINEWNKVRTVYHYQNSVNTRTYLFIDIFGDIFTDDFNRALALKSERTPEEKASKEYLAGIAKQATSTKFNHKSVQKFFDYLTELDRRRNTSWIKTFPWLEEQYNKLNR